MATTSGGIEILEGSWADVWPDGFMTKTQLSKAGFQTGKRLPAPAAALRWDSKAGKRHGGLLYLYDPTQAVPKRTMSDAQRAALEKAQAASKAAWHCTECGDRLHRPEKDGVCGRCEERLLSEHWAEKILAADTALILDAETTGLDTADDEFVELAIINLAGDTLFNRRIQPQNPDAVHDKDEDDPDARSAYDIHGISADELRQEQTFPELYEEIAAVLAGQTVIIYHADYDATMLASMCQRYGLPEIEFEDDCAMRAYSQWVGQWNSYWGNYRFQPLPGGDHSALGDCRATLDVIKRMANSEE